MKKFGFLALFAILFGCIASFHAEANTKISKELMLKSQKMMLSHILNISWKGYGCICIGHGEQCGIIVLTLERNISTERTDNPPGSVWGVLTSSDGVPFSGNPTVTEAGGTVITPDDYTSDDGYAQTINIPLQNAEYNAQLGGYVVYYFEQ